MKCKIFCQCFKVDTQFKNLHGYTTVEDRQNQRMQETQKKLEAEIDRIVSASMEPVLDCLDQHQQKMYFFYIVRG